MGIVNGQIGTSASAADASKNSVSVQPEQDLARKRKVPPRALEPGDIVTTYSRHLGEWTAAQITMLDEKRGTAGVLELAWCGPRPAAVEDLGEVKPLVLGHHYHHGRLAYTNLKWLLPRGYHVIGRLPLMVDTPSDSFGGWVVGGQLALQRRWDAGDRSKWADPSELILSGAATTTLLSISGQARLDILALDVHSVEDLDCQLLVERFPNVSELRLRGQLGTLRNADQLNRLPALRWFTIFDLFGMTDTDVLQPANAPHLEHLTLYGVPKEYADASRARWKKEIPHGTDVEIASSRKPDWIAENRDNPLRNWDGDEHISRAIFNKSVAQYKLTRRAVQESLARHVDEDELDQIGREFGVAFNKLNARKAFIETIEQDDLFDALAFLASGLANPSDVETVKAALQRGADAVRTW